MKRTLQLALLLALFLVCGRSAFAQAGFVAGQAFTYTPGGAFPAGGSIVTICTTGGTGTPCTPTVTLYQDSAASIPVANPLAACTSSPQIGCLDGYGNFSFYVAVAGAYTYTITSLSGLNPYGPVPIIAQTIGGGATAANLLGPGFISGTFSGNNKLTGTTTAAQINNTIYIDGTVYACDDVGINAAITALGTAGGIVDASYCIGFGVNGGKNILATVIVGANTGTASHGVLLKFGCDSSAWLVSPTISAQHVFEVADNSAIEGCAYGGTRIFVSNTGTPSLLDVVSFIGNPANSSITENARVSNLWIENDNASATITNGLINLQTAYDSVIQDVKLVGYAPCLLYASDTASGAIAPNSDDIINLLADGLDDAGTQPICIQSVAGGYPGPIRFYGGDFGHPGAGKNLVLINTPAGIGHSYGIRFTNVYMEGNAAADTTTPLIAASDTEGLSLDGVWAGMNSTSTASCLSLSSTLGVTGAITVKDFTCTSLSGTTNAITSTVTGAPSFTGVQVTYYSANGDGLLASEKSSALLGGVRQLCFNGSTSGVACIQPAPVAGTPCNWLLPAANPTVGQILSSAAPSGGNCILSWSSASSGAAIYANSYTPFAGKILYACTWSNGSAVITCPSGTFTSAVVGYDAFATSANQVGGAGFASSIFVCGAAGVRTYIQTYTDSAHVTLSQNCTENSNTNPFFFGPNEDTGVGNFSTAVNSACGVGIVPAGFALIKSSKFINAPTTNCISPVGTTRQSPVLYGQGAGASQFIVAPDFNWTTCTGGNSGKDCFFGSAGPGNSGSYSVSELGFNGLGGNYTISSTTYFAEFDANTYGKYLYFMGIGPQNANLTCILANSTPINLDFIQADACGAKSFYGGNIGDPVTVEHSYFGDTNCDSSNGGFDALGSLVTNGNIYGPCWSNSTYMTNVTGGGSVIWNSSGDQWLDGGSGTSVVFIGNNTAAGVVNVSQGQIIGQNASQIGVYAGISGARVSLLQTLISMTGATSPAFTTVSGTTVDSSPCGNRYSETGNSTFFGFLPCPTESYASITIPAGTAYVSGVPLKVPILNTTTNCSAAGSGANPSLVACGAAPAGAFSCATNASTGTCTVATTAVTTNSDILIQPTGSTVVGTRLSVTCNTTADTGLAAPRLAGIVNATSFTINLGTFATSPLCFMYHIVN